MLFFVFKLNFFHSFLLFLFLLSNFLKFLKLKCFDCLKTFFSFLFIKHLACTHQFAIIQKCNMICKCIQWRSGKRMAMVPKVKVNIYTHATAPTSHPSLNEEDKFPASVKMIPSTNRPLGLSGLQFLRPRGAKLFSVPIGRTHIDAIFRYSNCSEIN